MKTVDKNIAFQHALQVFEDRNRAFRILYETVMEVAGVTERELYTTLCQNLGKICNSRKTAIASFDSESGKLILECADSPDKSMDLFIPEPERPWIKLPQKVIDDLKTRQVQACSEHDDCLVDFFPGQLNKCHTHANHNCYRVSFVRENELLAVGMIQFRAGEKLKLKDMLDTYMNLSGVIIQRLNAIKALKRSEQQLRNIVTNINDFIYVLDSAGEITYVNPTVTQILGYEPEQLLGKRFEDLLTDHPANGEYKNIFQEELKGNPPVEPFECQVFTVDEKKITLEIKDAVIRCQGAVHSIQGICRDITHRKRAEEMAQLRKELGRALNGKISLDKTFRYCLETAMRMGGMDCGGFYLWDESSKQFFLAYYTGLSPELARQEVCFNPRGFWGEDGNIIMKGMAVYLKKADIGKIFPECINAGLQFIGIIPVVHEGKVIACLNMGSRQMEEMDPAARTALEDMVSHLGSAIARIKAEEELAAEKERLAVTLRSIGDGVITTDTIGRVTMLNRVAEQLTGWSNRDAVGKEITEVFRIVNELTGEDCTNPVDKTLKTGQICELDDHTSLIARNGIKRVIADSGAPIRDRDSRIIGAVLVFRDITDKKKMEEELSRAQKLESVGVLAGGIAHDFNNLLTVILGNINMAKICAAPEDDIYEELKEGEKAVLQAKNLTQQLLTFSKGGAPVKKTFTVEDILNETARFALRGSNVNFNIEIPDDLSPVEVDVGQINQVIHNIVINADQSMPQGGTVNIRAENVNIDEESHLPLAPGDYVAVSIIDKGVGITGEYLDKIFDPYFTTKQKGSGLGLAVSYSIIKNHGGHIQVESKVGEGSTFRFFLPASKEKVEKKENKTKITIQGKGKILLMDDEMLIQRIASKLIKKLGYEITVKGDGLETLQEYSKARQEGKPYDLVILDLTIPGGMGGKETIEKLKEIDPKVRAIVSSGYSNDPIMAEYDKFGFVDVMAKPYQLSDLSQVLSRVLNGG